MGMTLLMNGAMTGTKMCDAKHYANCSIMNDRSAMALMQAVIFLQSHTGLLRKRHRSRPRTPHHGLDAPFQFVFLQRQNTRLFPGPKNRQGECEGLNHLKSRAAAVEIRRLVQGGVRRVSR